MKKVILRVLKYLALVAVALPLMLVVINTDTFDEGYAPGLAAILDAGAGAVPAHENAYVYAAGLDAPPGSRPLQIGARYLEAINGALEADPEDRASALDDLSAEFFGDKGHLEMLEESIHPRCKVREATDCVTARAEVRDVIDAAHRASSGQLARYDELFTLPHYRQTAISSFAAPLVSVNGLQWYVSNDRLILLAEQGKLDAALDLAIREQRYWRMVLREGDLLIDKMVAASRVETLYWLLADLDRHYGFSREQLRVARELVTPLTAEEYSLRRALEGEVRWGVDATNNLFQAYEAESMGDYFSGDYWGLVLTQPRATQNAIYRNYEPLLALSDKTAQEFVTGVDVLHTEYWEPGLDLVYNPVGKILAGIAMPDLTQYIERMHDLEARRRLIALYLALRLEGPGHADDLLGDAAFLDPYSLTPVDWDAGTHTLTARCRDTENRCALSLP